MKSFRATVLLVFALISFSTLPAFADCSLCPRNASSCTVGGITYSHCFNGMNGVYYSTVDINSECQPSNIDDPLTYFGYPFSVNGVTKYSSCYSGASPASDCYPAGQCATSSTPNCQLGMYSISGYDASGNLKGRVYCSLIEKDAYTQFRGDLYHNCANSSYGGPFLVLPPALPGSPDSPPPVLEVVQNLVGQTLAAAENILSNLGQLLGSVTYAFNGVPAGSFPFGLSFVIGQSPAPGTSVLSGTKVDVVESGMPSANVCPNGQTTPAPCSATMTLQFNVPAGTTLGANPVQVVTQGALNLDFTLASTTCSGISGNCAANVTFAPTAPGVRLGSVSLTDSSGNVVASTLVAGIGNGPAMAFMPGAQVTVASGFAPTGVAVDAAGDVFIADDTNGQIVEVPAGGGAQKTVASGLSAPGGVAVDGAGNVFIADSGNNQVVEVPAGGGAQTTVASGLSGAAGVAVDGTGDVLIAEPAVSQVVLVSPAGLQLGAVESSQSTQSPVLAVVPSLSSPQGMAVDGAGDLFIVDSVAKNVVKIAPGGTVTTLEATGLSTPVGVAVDAAGDVFIVDSGNNNVVELPADGSPQITVASGLSSPTDVAVDGAGDIFIADTGNNRVIELLRAQAPSLTFASTAVGSTSSDSPQSVIAQNIGNQPLGAVAPGLAVTGPNFMQVAGPGTPADCTSSFALAPGAGCNLSLSFEPQSTGPLTSTAAFTDNALNWSPSAPPQTIMLAGTGTLSVPNVVGLTQAAATTAITSAGLVVGTTSNASSSTVPIGSVISESPAAGTPVNGGSSVNLVISSGVSVPNVVSQTQAAATTAITTAGLMVGTTTNASSKTVPIGSVISESPAAGTQVSAGSSVNLVISSGVTVPNVVNDTQAAATTAITGAGLVVGTTTNASSSTVAIGSVISESPAAGTAVNGGSSVNLVISTGVTVPNVVGQTRAAATTAITAAGLVVGTTTSASSSTAPSGSVISENPVAGTHVNGGSAIALVISTGPAQYLLTTAANPPSGGTVTPATGNQNANAVVALKATPNPGYVFSNWTGPVANATSASTTVAMTGAESVTANFISALTVSPSPTYNFGTVYQGSITTQNFTVTNIGTTPFSISGAFISIVKGGNSNEFVEVDECPKSLAGGSHCTISVSFIAGPYYTPQTATLTITDNAPGNPQTVTLTATVIDPQASFNPTSLSFGNQTVNTSVTKTVTLKNTGGTALSITGMTVKGTNPAEFTLTPASNCGSSLGAGDSCVISVTFKPLAKVSYSATLNVTDNTQQGTQTVSLSGAGH